MASSRKKNISVGIMTAASPGLPPSPAKSFTAGSAGKAAVWDSMFFVFSPADIHWEAGHVTGYVYSGKTSGWERRLCPFPDFVYDRCFCTNGSQFNEYATQLRRIRREPGIRLLGSVLKGKADVYAALAADAEIKPCLPYTIKLEKQALLTWLQRHDAAYLKPEAGSQGKGGLLVERRSCGEPSEDKYSVKGRDFNNRQIEISFRDSRELLGWLQAFTGQRRYLLQPFLQLTDFWGEPYDIRALVQKDGTGGWTLTGFAARKGAAGGITSNLHGGGTAWEAAPFLQKLFGADESSAILQTLNRLSAKIPPLLEQSFGRLLELGIDYGIDRSGRIWILEANSKPGRSAFEHLPDQQIKACSVVNPLRYARYLADRTLSNRVILGGYP